MEKQLGPPHDLPTYLHRVGRTGRFDSLGLALTLLWEEEVPELQTLLKQLRVAVPPLPYSFDESIYLEDMPPDTDPG